MEPPEITSAEFGQIRRLIHDIAGISLAQSKRALVVGRLARRLNHHGCTSFAQYYRLLQSAEAQDELQVMVDLLTTNETYFFREEAHFEYLAKVVAPAFAPARPLEVWSAASSTGEEVYSIAMVLADCLGLDAPWTVTGSDISQSVLETARRGLYRADRVRNLSYAAMVKYFLKGVGENEGTLLVAPEVRSHTRFLQVNLNRALPELGRFHVVFLRNVMIYFDAETKWEVVERLTQRLMPGGHLIVGHSETLNGMPHRLRMIRPTIYRLPA